MIDERGRKIDYIRISLTDRCNLRCRYCMPSGGVEALAHDKIIRFEELLRLCGIFSQLGINKFKISGGEPLVRKGACGFIGELKSLPGVEQVTLTTNGQLLDKYLPELRQAQVDGINISMDTLNAEKYRYITRGGCLDTALAAIDNAYRAGFCPVKINCVAMKGFNDDEFAELARISRDRKISLRFIEIMPIGLGSCFAGISSDNILDTLTDIYGKPKQLRDKLGNGPARYYLFPDFASPIGIIDAVSHGFCLECNRVRLTADGHLKLCLNFDLGCDLLTPMRHGWGDEDLKKLIYDTVRKKPESHSFGKEKEHTEIKNMNQIGG